MAMLLILMLLMAMLPFAFAHSGDRINAPQLTVAVTIDGNWSTGEWADAPQYTMIGNQTSYIRAKYNSTHLLVIIDSPWDTTNATYFWHENFWLAFDTAHDGGGAPKNDDNLVSGQSDNTDGGLGTGWVGNGTGWTPKYIGGIGTIKLVQSGDWSNTTGMQPSPNSATPHRISEMMVPLALIGSPGSTVGFYAQVDDESSKPGWPSGDPTANATAYSEWPPTAGGSPEWPGYGSGPCPAPNAWGNLVLVTPVGGIWISVHKLGLLVPYISLTLTIILAIAVTATFFKYRKKQ